MASLAGTPIGGLVGMGVDGICSTSILKIWATSQPVIQLIVYGMRAPAGTHPELPRLLLKSCSPPWRGRVMSGMKGEAVRARTL